MTEPTPNPFDYSRWTPAQHVAKAVELAGEADAKAEHPIGSQANLQRADVEQITARAKLHLSLAEAKRPEPEPEEKMETSEPVKVEPTPELQPATRTRRQSKNSVA